MTTNIIPLSIDTILKATEKIKIFGTEVCICVVVGNSLFYFFPSHQVPTQLIELHTSFNLNFK